MILSNECMANVLCRSRKRGRWLAVEEDHVVSAPDALQNLDPVQIVATGIPEPSSRTAPIFVGDGGYSAILDAAGETTEHHIHVPAAAEKSLAAEDLEYLKVKGCFSLPAESRKLLVAYFKFVHPTFPVIDGPAFLHDYAANGLGGINLLLLWSMFSVSASYISLPSRTTAKELYARRAKLLFDLSEEKDKIILVQSALLLSFWFADTEDVKQSWYWTSIAFGIAQTLGLHREVKNTQIQVSDAQRTLWRNVWWCCMTRDVWLAFGMGRPLRLDSSNCDCPLPRDSKNQFLNMVIHDELLYSLEEASSFATMWLRLITASDVLRDVLLSKSPSLTSVKHLKAQSSSHCGSSSSSSTKRVDRHLKLHQYATLVALARSTCSEDELRTTADSTTTVLEDFLADETTAYVAPVTVPLVVPAMATYLNTLKSSSADARTLANDKLRTYRSFLNAIEDNYPAASIVKGLLDTAQTLATGTDANQKAPRDKYTPGTIEQLPSTWEFDWPGGSGQNLWLSPVVASKNVSSHSYMDLA
jgi:hypothetical protein